MGLKKGFLIAGIMVICVMNPVGTMAADESGGQSGKMEITSVVFPLSVREKVEPDEYYMGVEIRAKGKSEKEVIGLLGKVDAAVRKSRVEYSGGGFNVRENCWWEKGRKKCEGFIGTIGYEFYGRGFDFQKKIVRVLTGLKEKVGKRMEFLVKRVGWRVSDEKEERERTKLMILLLKKAGILKEKIEGVSGKRCYVKKVNYERRWYFPLEKEFGAARLAESVPVPEPKKEKHKIEVSGVVEIECVEK